MWQFFSQSHDQWLTDIRQYVNQQLQISMPNLCEFLSQCKLQEHFKYVPMHWHHLQGENGDCRVDQMVQCQHTVWQKPQKPNLDVG
jgi:hypothetical protein